MVREEATLTQNWEGWRQGQANTHRAPGLRNPAVFCCFGRVLLTMLWELSVLEGEQFNEGKLTLLKD